MTSFEDFLERATAPGPNRLLAGCAVIAANKDGMSTWIFGRRLSRGRAKNRHTLSAGDSNHRVRVYRPPKKVEIHENADHGKESRTLSASARSRSTRPHHWYTHPPLWTLLCGSHLAQSS
jgi:hypothetical protein